MATTAGELIVKISANLDDFKKNMGEVDRSLQNIGGKLKTAGMNMTKFISIPLAAAGLASVKFASDMTETMNKVSVVFGDNAKEVEKWSKNSISKMGLASQTALDAAALFGDMGTSMGFNSKEAANMGMGLTQLGADLASFKNIPVQQAMNALSGVFTGETESLKGLGIVMTQTNLDAFAMSKGLGKTTQEMSQAEQVSLRYAYILDKTKNAQGDFARTSGGTANQSRMLWQNIKQLGATVGAVIMPAFTAAVQSINGMLQSLQNLNPTILKILVAFGAVLAIAGPLVLALGAVAFALPSITQGLLLMKPAIAGVGKAFMFLFTTQTGLVIVAIAAVVAAAYYLYKNWATVSIYLKKAWLGVAYAFEQAWSYIKTIGLKYLSILLAVYSKLLGWIPGLGKKFEKAKKAVSGMIDAEKVKRDQNKAQYHMKQTALTAQLQKIKADKTKDSAKKLSDTTKDLGKSNSKTSKDIKKNTKEIKDQQGALASFDKLNILSLNNSGITVKPTIKVDKKTAVDDGTKQVGEIITEIEDKTKNKNIKTKPKVTIDKNSKDTKEKQKTWLYNYGQDFQNLATSSPTLLALDTSAKVNSPSGPSMIEWFGKVFKDIGNWWSDFWNGKKKDKSDQKRLKVDLNSEVKAHAKKGILTQSLSDLWASVKGWWNDYFNGTKKDKSDEKNLNKTIDANIQVKSEKKTFLDKLGSFWKNIKSWWAEFWGGKGLSFNISEPANIKVDKNGKVINSSYPANIATATGGVFQKPSLRLIGEAGAEAVVPLSRNTEWVDIMAGMLSDKMGSAGGNQDYTFVIGGQKIGSISSKEIARLNRQAGKTIIPI